MTRPAFFDRAGNPIDHAEWFRLLETPDYGVVENTRLRDVEVSTVWLGLAHNHGGDGPPLIFQTVIFGLGEDEPTFRYATEAEARAGHEKAVEAVRRR